MNNAVVNVHLAVCHPFVGLATVFRGTCTSMCTVVHVYLYMQLEESSLHVDCTAALILTDTATYVQYMYRVVPLSRKSCLCTSLVLGQQSCVDTCIQHHYLSMGNQSRYIWAYMYNLTAQKLLSTRTYNLTERQYYLYCVHCKQFLSERFTLATKSVSSSNISFFFLLAQQRMSQPSQSSPSSSSSPPSSSTYIAQPPGTLHMDTAILSISHSPLSVMDATACQPSIPIDTNGQVSSN